MAARDHFRANARRRVELTAKLRAREGAAPDMMRGSIAPTSSEPRSSAAADAFWQAVRIRDMSLGGACVEITEASGVVTLEREAVVMIEVTAPTLWDPLVLRGKIAWLRRGVAGRPTRAGVRFEHRDAGSLFALFQLLGAHAFDA